MTEDVPPPLAPDLDALLSAERRYPEPAAGVRARVLARVHATIGLGAPAPGGPATGLAARGWVLALGAFALGVVTSLGVKTWIDQAQEPAPPPLPAVRESRPSVAPTVPAEVVRPPEPIPAPQAPAAVRPKPSRSAPIEDALEAERIILQRARAHLARADGTAALREIEGHARDFPGGALAEEREALAVRALIATGDHEGARVRGARFGRRYPRSIYLQAVEQALETTP